MELLVLFVLFLLRKMLHIRPICTTALYDQRSDDFKPK
uniref:Uncharacterized protein n=1 Tax=Arundo donax TaxID=35708 RepID=A0A0A8XY08_ARUDO